MDELIKQLVDKVENAGIKDRNRAEQLVSYIWNTALGYAVSEIHNSYHKI